MSSPGDRPVYLTRTTLGIASAILVVTSFIGLLYAPPGVIIGPVIDRFITPHLLKRRGYVSPGPPLWAVAVGGLLTGRRAPGVRVAPNVGPTPS